MNAAEFLRLDLRAMSGVALVFSIVSGGALSAQPEGANGPQSVAADCHGAVYMADAANHSILKMSPAGTTSTFAGLPDAFGSEDGTAANARFNGPAGIALDCAGNLYVADVNNHTVRKVTAAGVVTTLAGQAGVAGSSDGVGTAATFSGPHGVAVDRDGNVYVADTDNSTIRRISRDGIVTTLAGTAGVTGGRDGIGAEATFRFPQDLAADSAGNVYVAEVNSHTIRVISPQGLVTTIAGKQGESGSEDGTAADARFNFPRGLAVDGEGNVYVADSNNYAIRKITPAGEVATVARVARRMHPDGASAMEPIVLPAGVSISGEMLHITLYRGVSMIRSLAPVEFAAPAQTAASEMVR